MTEPAMVPIPPEPGLRDEYRTGDPATAKAILGPHAAGRAVWEVCYARFALREAVRLLRLAPGDEVLMPAFCCNTVSTPIEAAEARPLLYRVGFDAQPNWTDLAEKARSPRVRALIVVHYLGFATDLAAPLAICRERGLTLIEDCSHALFCRAGRKPVGRTADLASFSLYKMVPVSHGAALVVNPRRFAAPLPVSSEPGPESRRETHLGNIEDRLIEYDDSARSGGKRPDIAARDRMMQTSRELYAAHTDPHGIGRSARIVLGQVDRRRIVAARRANYRYLLARLGDWALIPSLPAGACPLGFPVLVADRERVKAGLDAAGIGYLIHWSRKLIPTGGLDAGPEVPFLADHVMTLPCHQDLQARHLDYLVQRFRALGVSRAASAS
jgi:dTDP-4-amino-4,6-dideoxygalactose transaminase